MLSFIESKELVLSNSMQEHSAHFSSQGEISQEITKPLVHRLLDEEKFSKPLQKKKNAIEGDLLIKLLEEERDDYLTEDNSDDEDQKNKAKFRKHKKKTYE